MSNYNKIYDSNPEIKHFYNNRGYEGKKLVAGTISLKNALVRMKEPFEEYYVLVTYKEGEQLPEGYIPISEYKSDNGTLFATINPDPFKLRIDDICNYNNPSSIQRITRMDMGKRDWIHGDPNELISIPDYLLGPGPNTVRLIDLIDSEYFAYCKEHGINITSSKSARM